ncbi:penicillin-binding protein [Bifidobacterium sp. UTCIF-3]|uniref:transglycosylase domain-containing protein n=1 Tax=unclassified Bifidobacterium TaxID=2608897 RepID=UPI001DE9EA5C|nr:MULTISPECIES: transglycosylase domain-containing protein [unclassified Bifidobacterium]TPF77539.1 penicillin-binding protein [Bifidobacterium sp. UTCIF-1]TPF79580.1 penicillin-binding protein [Bifidobacterium sp. UTCIF-24]TPF81501.1 penicillin-binding protein [Bifidobacterium sp. UTCIF-3]TPF83616.1 penicillin-binding protein [Bifidobacterium sp. UTCIF-36]
MASYQRRARAGSDGPALRQPRTAHSKSGQAAQEGAYRTGSGRSGSRADGTGTRRSSSHRASQASHASRTGSARTARTAHATHRSRNHKNNNGGKGKHRVLKWVLGIFFGLIGVGLLAGIGVFAYLYITTEVPQPEKFALAEKTTVYYADGTTPIGSYAEQNREIISCTDLPDYIGNAIVASENRTFYTDKGIDLKGIARAFLNNVTTGTRQGGSTITQQYAERYYLGETTTYVGKAREAILALKIAQTESKDEVLCNYMNTIYLGRNAYGIQAAAKAYFNKDAKDLTLPEAAMIAGIIPAPSTWDPADSPKIAQQRFNRVLSIMEEDGYITAKQHKEATFPQTAEVAQQNEYQGPNGYLLDMVQRELVGSKAFTKEDLATGGYKIVTTIDKAKQDLMQSVGDTRADGMPESIQVGGIAVEQKTGAVVSVYAGSDYLSKPLNNADQALFEPGSTMKPFALLGAAQEGVSFNTMFNGNSHQHFSGITAEVNNALNINWGNINLYQATANSVNTVFMNVNEHLTPQRTAKIAHEAGITGDIDETSPYNVLGINALTVWDLAQGHSTIANNGVKNTLHMVAKVQDSKGKDLYNAPNENKKVFDANDCALVQKAMQGTTTSGTAAGVSSALGGRQVAGKSGTANDELAASFVGYTPSLMNVWAIWNPDADGNPQVVPAFGGYGVTSTGYPAHLFTEYMSQALAGTAVEQFTTAKDSGKVGGPDGTWGLGGSKSSSTNGQSGTQNGRSNSDSSSGSTSGQSSTQEFAQQCLNNASYSTECPNYPGPPSGGNGGNGDNGSGNGDGGDGGNGGNGDSGGNSGNSNGNGNSGSSDSGGNTGSNSGNGNGTPSGETTGGNS